MHKFLKELKVNDWVDCVYVKPFTKYDEDLRVRPAVNGNKFVIIKITDNSLPKFNQAKVYFYFNNESELENLKKTRYFKVKGKCSSLSPEISINSNEVLPASDMVFDRGDLFASDDYYKNQLLSYKGLRTNLTHTSAAAFQEDYDLVDIGDKLECTRIKGSPHDRNQFSIKIENIEEEFNIPAHITPSMAELYEQGYVFNVIVDNVTPRDEKLGRNAGISVIIRGERNGH